MLPGNWCERRERSETETETETERGKRRGRVLRREIQVYHQVHGTLPLIQP